MTGLLSSVLKSVAMLLTELHQYRSAFFAYVVKLLKLEVLRLIKSSQKTESARRASS